MSEKESGKNIETGLKPEEIEKNEEMPAIKMEAPDVLRAAIEKAHQKIESATIESPETDHDLTDQSELQFISVDHEKLKMLMIREGVADWKIEIDERNFIPWPNYASGKNKKTITLRPRNLWSHLMPFLKSEKGLAWRLAHEVRHAAQPSSDREGILWTIARLLKNGYWFDNKEKDAREWAEQHWEEFRKIIKFR